MQDHIKINDTRCDSVRKNFNQKCDQSENNKKYSPKRSEINTIRYHALKLNQSHIRLIDSRDKFIEMLSYLTSQQFVAFDAEWKPICTTSSQTVALIQFATAERIYLLDVVTIQLNNGDWNRLANDVFNNLEILKIGNI